MSYNPEIHHRRSIRLKGYDYSREGIYFITICVQDRDCLFGEIVAGANSDSTLRSPIMILNNAGKMVERWYRELENKYPDKRCHEMVIMPNHFHCIIENMGAGSQLNNGSQLDDVSQLDAHVGAPLRGRPMIMCIPMILIMCIPTMKNTDCTIKNTMLPLEIWWIGSKR